jgi:hypothetical protein
MWRVHAGIEAASQNYIRALNAMWLNLNSRSVLAEAYFAGNYTLEYFRLSVKGVLTAS